MRRKIRFIKRWSLRIDDTNTTFEKDAETEVEEKIAVRLIQLGVALLGGEQHGPAIRMASD